MTLGTVLLHKHEKTKKKKLRKCLEKHEVQAIPYSRGLY